MLGRVKKERMVPENWVAAKWLYFFMVKFKYVLIKLTVQTTDLSPGTCKDVTIFLLQTFGPVVLAPIIHSNKVCLHVKQ